MSDLVSWRHEAPLESSFGAHLRGAIAGDASARAWLYDTFAPRLYRRLRARYGRRTGLDVDDAFQDAWVFFFQHEARVLAQFLDRTSPDECTAARLDGYLWGLACGIASNRLRSARRHREATLYRDPVSHGGESDAIGRDTLGRLSSCLRSAGTRVYLYYKLRFVDGLAPNEIATATGWSRKATYKLKLSLNEAVARCAARLGLV